MIFRNVKYKFIIYFFFQGYLIVVETVFQVSLSFILFNDYAELTQSTGKVISLISHWEGT